MALTDLESGRALFRLRIAGLAVLIIGVLLAWFIGAGVGALHTQYLNGPFKGFSSTNMAVAPGTLTAGNTKGFNWLIAILTFAPFLVSSAVLFSGAEVCLAIARRTRTRIATLLDEE